MANKKNKTNKLVSTARRHANEDVLTLPTLTQAVSQPLALAETEEKTVDVDTLMASEHARTRSELKHLIAAQSARIADLEYRLEDSRMRQRGMDEELKVREEITADINREIREARKQLLSAGDELQMLNERYLAMRAHYDESAAQARSLQSSVDEQRQQIASKDALIVELQATLGATTDNLSDLRTYVDGRREIWSQRDAEAAVLQAEIEQLRDEIRALEHATSREKTSELRENRRRIAAQSGEIAAQSVEIEALRNDNERFENYGDDLRKKLQDQIDETREATSLREKLEANLDVAGKMINDLNRQLESEKTKTQLQREANDNLLAQLEREKRQIRSELTNAQKTISAQEAVNEQLSSDLIDHQGFRQALESHLNDVETDNARKMKRLESELSKARDMTIEFERELRVKDGAIADLMQELEDQGSKLKLTSELETALQKIDGNKTPARTSPPARADRVTRQLIGSADGKELRFPLFRNRLSIGRTRHNDIQLDLRFVSRRHAVIATDNDTTRLIDWGSRNGVYVNKKRVTEKILKSGDVITIGLTNLRYEERPKR